MKSLTLSDEEAKALVRVLEFYGDDENYDVGRGDVTISDMEVFADHGAQARQLLAILKGRLK